MRAYDLTVTGSLIVSGSTTLTGDISYDDLTATGNIVTTGANKVRRRREILVGRAI